MSRGVRDLRELICVSRLTFRHSDEEEEFSDPAKLSGESSSERCPSQVSEKHSFDSGFYTNGDQPEKTAVDYVIAADTKVKPKKRKKRRKRGKNVSVGHELPKSEPLPPVQGASARSNDSSTGDEASRSVDDPHGNFDDILCYLDASMLSEWLPRANSAVSDLSLWCHNGDNFIEFAHFLLTDFQALKWQEILQLEHSILIDELSLLFAAGHDNGNIRYGDLIRLIGAVVREYPAKLFSSKGTFLFLTYLDILSSERKDIYKKLLSDVKISTRNEVHAQWALAIRAYALGNIWYSVVMFYRRLNTARPEDYLKKLNMKLLREDMSRERLNQAIKRGFVDVVNYFIMSGKVDPCCFDEHHRSLIFIAVMYNRVEVLRYLLTQVKPRIDVNIPSDSGNTPLHAAANNGDITMVTTLVKDGNADVNKVNKQCDSATALHMAVLHGHTEVVEFLLSVGADFTMRMDGLTPADIALEFNHTDIQQLFIQDIDTSQ